MEILKIRENRDWIKEASMWFHEKWQVPQEAYRESMEECLKGKYNIPQWYIAVEENVIIGGIGVIENDFHKRKDLTPNVCALYVEEDYRCKGIAGQLLEYVSEDMNRLGVGMLYLVTDHTSFYERYGWEFLGMVQEEDSEEKIRMYKKKACKKKTETMMEQILSYLTRKYVPKAILVYGSYKDGSNNEASDFDALVISENSPFTHDMSVVNGVALDVFVYPKPDLKEQQDWEKFIQIYDSRVVLDTEGLGENLRKQVIQYVDRKPFKNKKEVDAEIEWCRKMAMRAKRKDTEGMLRWHWVLTDSLEIFCDAAGCRYWGPKKTLRWMEEQYPNAFHKYQDALLNMNGAALDGWIACLEEAAFAYGTNP